MITSKKVFEMLAVFDVLPEDVLTNKKKFSMDIPQIYQEGVGASTKEKYDVPIPQHNCGTVHCFAGWFLVAKHFAEIRGGKFVSGIFKDNECVRYINGVFAIYNHFFPDIDNRGLSALDYEHGIFSKFDDDIWGNSYQIGMFRNEGAFTPRDNDWANNLQDVLDHWGEVGLRLYIKELFVEGEKYV